jgi:hypothetical protein
MFKEEFSNRCKMQGTTPEINGINITVSGVEKPLSKLNPTKAAGPDNITPRVLKELAPFIAPILTVIFKISYESGPIPAVLSVGVLLILMAVSVYHLIFYA